MVFVLGVVACNFARFHTFIVVANYIDISRKMNKGLQQESTVCTIGTIISVYEQL